MEVRQLEIFRTLAFELNFTRTAARVNTVQSNVTAQIKSLEEELGTRLFDRLAKSVTLTDAGRRFLPYAERALATMDEGVNVMKAGSEPEGVLTVGAPESILTYRLPAVIERFQKKYPKVELQFRPYLNTGVVAGLESGGLDMAISMIDAVEWPQLRWVSLYEEKILLLADPKHPLVKKKAVRAEDLKEQRLLLTEAGCCYRLKFDRVLAAAKTKPGNSAEFSSVEAIKQCMMAGMGIGVLPEIVVKEQLKAKQLAALKWAGQKLDVATYALWHKNKWMSPNIGAFLGVLRGK